MAVGGGVGGAQAGEPVTLGLGRIGCVVVETASEAVQLGRSGVQLDADVGGIGAVAEDAGQEAGQPLGLRQDQAAAMPVVLQAQSGRHVGDVSNVLHAHGTPGSAGRVTGRSRGEPFQGGLC